MRHSGNGPQREDGFTAIANEIMEQLAAVSLRGQQFRCLMFLFRKTYGFNKKEDKISLSQWAQGTKLDRNNAWRELQGLIKRNVIYCKSNGPKRPMTWGFNKHYDTWMGDSVVFCDYSSVGESVVAEDYSQETTVVAEDYKSVVTPHESTKEKKETNLAAASVRSPFVAAFEHVWGMMVPSPFVGDRIHEWETRVTLDGWRYALEECVTSGKLGQFKYLEGILRRVEREGMAPPPAAGTSTLSFAMEDIR